MLKKAIKINFICGFLVACLALMGQAKATLNEQRFASFYLLNKLSAKKQRIEVPIGAAYIIQDIRIVPRSCKKVKDELYKIDSYVADVEIFVEQECGEYKDHPGFHQPILLYKGDLTNNTRLPSSPIEHPIYDLIIIKCD